MRTRVHTGVASLWMKSSARKSYNKRSERRVSQNKSPYGRDSVKIPTFQSDAVQSLTYRYYVADNYGSDVLAFTIELPQYPYAHCYAPGYATLPFKAVRIKKIDMWCGFRSTVNVAGNTINLSFIERRTVRPLEWSDTAVPMFPARITKKFKDTEPLGLWYSTTSGEVNPEIRFQMPKGATLDITYDFILHDSEQEGTAASASFTTFPRVYTNQLHANVLPVGKTYVAVIAA